MAENVQEPVYLNYGQSQISQQDFLNSAANQVQNYVAKQPWSSKRKELFMKAYSDIMNLGVTGAYNDTGNWEIEYNGNINLDNLSKKEREMYGEAAYFIQQQMSSITPKAVEDETKKEELPIFTNEIFNTGLEAQLGKDKYGGRNYGQSEWNERDVANEYGIRGTQQRANALAEVLTNYANSLEDGKYTFEGSPYSDLSTLKNKMLNAAQQLRGGTWTADTLNELGINPEQYLSTGANEVDENGLTRKQKMELDIKAKADELAVKQKAEADEKALKIKQENELIRSNPFSKVRIKSGFNNMKGWSVNQIANQYTIATLADKLNELNGKADWTPDEQSLVAGAYKHAEKVPISQQEYNVLKRMTAFKDASKSRFSKIAGVDGMIYDSASGRLILAGEGVTQPTDWLTGKSDKDLEKNYLESKIPGVTNAEWKELMAIGADIASIVDPEPISAGVAGVGAAYLRHKAINETPGHKWTFLEGVGQGIDYLTGVIAAIPGFGDATLAAKVLTKINKPLRILGRVGAWKDLYDSVPGLEAAYNKWQNGEELTVGDWRAIGQGIRGLAGHSMLNRSNRAVRKVTAKSGYDATPDGILPIFKGHGKINDYLARRGWIGTKIGTDVEVPVLKVKNAEGKSEKIKITPEEKVKLEEAFSKTSKAEERTEAAKKILKKGTIKEGQTVEVNNNWKTRLVSHSDMTRRTSDSFDTAPESSTRKDDVFEDWLRKRDFRSKLYYGSNSFLRNIRANMKIYSGKTSENASKEEKKATKFLPTPQEMNDKKLVSTVKQANELGKVISGNNSKQFKQVMTIDNWYNNVSSGSFKRKPKITKDVKLDLGSENVDVKVTNGKSGQKYYKVRSKDGDKEITYPATSNVETLQKQIAEVVKRQHERLDMEKVREIRRIFGLKRGGAVEQDPGLQDTIQNFLNKQK